MKHQSGFTLVEVMVAIGVVAILAAILIPSMNAGSAQSRDAERKADLRTLQGALELYKKEYGRYPEGCNVLASDANQNAAWIGGNDYISGQVGTDYECPGGSAEYIRNDLSSTPEVENFAPQFIPVLPTDPRLNGSDSGYVYITNPDGTVYKLMALNTVETEVMTSVADTIDNPFSRCGNLQFTEVAICLGVPPGSSLSGSWPYNTGDTAASCQNVSDYADDFAVWGGLAPRGWQTPQYYDTPKAREYFSDRIHCR
jgi:prepilin-type N-terminal cleavage/methylation domain-containing protein